MKTKTFHPKQKDIIRSWHMVDANGAVLGRMATQVVKMLMGKHKSDYSPHMDVGDWVVVINASKVSLTGKKSEQKIYYRHSGYPGGFKKIKFAKLLSEQPEKIIELAVSRMLPTNRLKSKRLRRLKVYAGETHPYREKFKSLSTKSKTNSKSK